MFGRDYSQLKLIDELKKDEKKSEMGMSLEAFGTEHTGFMVVACLFFARIHFRGFGSLGVCGCGMTAMA